MRQINEDTGTTRPIQRKVMNVQSSFNNNHQTRSTSELETVVASFGYFLIFIIIFLIIDKILQFIYFDLLLFFLFC